MKLSYFVFLAMMVGMVGCEKEPETPKINIKRSTVQEIEDSMAASMAAAEANKKNQHKNGDEK